MYMYIKWYFFFIWMFFFIFDDSYKIFFKEPKLFFIEKFDYATRCLTLVIDN